MSKLDHPGRTKGTWGKRKTFYGICIFSFAVFCLGGVAYLKPVVVMDPEHPGVWVKNTGRLSALIHRVDGFWYWGGQVALLANIPSIEQRVDNDGVEVELQIPRIPAPGDHGIYSEHCYMKIVVRYTIPGAPVFRFKTAFFFEYRAEENAWISIRSIPPKFRSLGSLPVGNVGQIQLEFY